MRIFWQASPSISVSGWLQATVLIAPKNCRSRYRGNNDYSLVHICKGYPHQDSSLGIPFLLSCFSAIDFIKSITQGFLPDIEITGIFKITSGNNTLDSLYDLLLRNCGVIFIVVSHSIVYSEVDDLGSSFTTRTGTYSHAGVNQLVSEIY